MGYVLIWIESLAAGLLFVAAACALAGRLEKQALRPLIPSLAFFLPFMLGVLATILGWFLLSENIQPQWLFAYSLTWTIIFAASSVWLLMRAGLGSWKKAGSNACSQWPSCTLGSVFGIMLAVYVGTVAIMDADVRTRAASLQAEAVAKAASLMPPSVPDEHNARFVYEEAFKILDASNVNNWNRKSRNPGFDPAADELRSFLGTQERALALIRRATAMPDYHRLLELRFDFPIPAFAKYRSAAFLLTLDAKAKAADGNVKGALENIMAIRAETGHLRRIPFLIDSMISMALEGISLSALEHVLAISPDVPDDVIALPVRTESFYQQALRRAMKFEEAFTVGGIAGLVAKGDKGNVTGDLFGIGAGAFEPLLTPLLRAYLFHYDLVFLPKHWRALHKMAVKSYHEMQDELKEWSGKIESDPDRGIVSAIAIPQFHRYILRGVRADAMVLLSQLALAVTAYKAEEDEYPAKLSDLAPKYLTEVPTDPFDGKPMRMKPVEDGLILYSVGKNLKDDGGIIDDWKKGDIAFYLGAAYTEYRLKPALEEAKKKAEQKKKKAKAKKKK